MATFCPTLSADPAIMAVGDAHYQFKDFATRAYELAIQQTQALNGFTPIGQNFAVSFDFDAQLAAFQRPQAPVVNRADFELRAPADAPAPAAFEARDVALAEVPDGMPEAPALAFPARPVSPNIAAPTPPPRARALVMPDKPDAPLPEVPTFEQLNLPAVPAVALPTFDSDRPVFDEPVLRDDWQFNPERYVSEFLAHVQGKVRRMMDGEGGLPESIERALFARGRDRIDTEAQAEVSQAADEWGSRGFSEPPGQLKARVDAVRQGAQSRKADHIRDVSIEVFREKLADVRLAVQQGIALETTLVNLHIEEQRLALQAAQFLRETSIALLNARITVFNARLEAYRVDAQVLEQRIRAELAKVEIYRAQIEGERARGEINEQRVRIYAEQIRGVQALADFYRTQVEGVRAEADVEKLAIDRYRAEVDAYGARWTALGKEFDTYRAAVEAEGVKATVHRNLVDAYGSRVQAVTARNRGAIDAEQLRIQQHGQLLDTFRALLARQGQQLEAERARLASLAALASADASIYTARANVEQAASAATDRSFQLGMERAKALVDTQLKTADLKISQNVQLTSLALEAAKTRGTVAAQLAASAMSAVNYSATVSSGRTETKSCSTDFRFDGEIADSGI